jgi:hypothetical protein
MWRPCRGKDGGNQACCFQEGQRLVWGKEVRGPELAFVSGIGVGNQQLRAMARGSIFTLLIVVVICLSVI